MGASIKFLILDSVQEELIRVFTYKMNSMLTHLAVDPFSCSTPSGMAAFPGNISWLGQHREEAPGTIRDGNLP